MPRVEITRERFGAVVPLRGAYARERARAAEDWVQLCRCRHAAAPPRAEG
jgi:hypothetical protein